MGVIKRGILGGFSNKVANVVGSSWKGIAVMRSLPLSVANPKTTAQTEVRTRFKSLSELGSSLLTGIIKPLWDRSAQQMSGYNAWRQANTDAFNLTTGAFVPASLVTSKGKLGATAVGVIEANPDTINVDWVSAAEGAYQAASDLAYICVLNADGTVLGISSGVVPRSAGTASFSIDAITAGEEVEVYLAFLRADGSISGDSSFKSAIVVS